MNTFSERYALSPMQQGMVFHTLYAPRSGHYIQQVLCKFQEKLNAAAFEAAWQRVIERHPVLRTSFCLDGAGKFFQEVALQINVSLELRDWREYSRAQQQEQLEQFLQEDRKRGFDLSRAGPMRLSLFRLSETHYQFIWTYHHAILDGRSRLLVFKEVFAFYEAFCRGEDFSLELPRPFQEYSDWLQKQDFSQAETFWRKRLEGFIAPTPLIRPAISSATSTEGEPPQRQTLELSETLTSQLRVLAEQHQLSLNTFVQGAWGVLQSRYSGESDIVFGAVRACRHSSVEGAPSMVGLLVNTLPLRIQVSPDIRLLPWLQSIRGQWLELREFEHTPLARVQEWSELPRTTPLFESVVAFENHEFDSAMKAVATNWGNRKCFLLQTTNYLLSLGAFGEKQLLLAITFDQNRFDAATIQRMLGHLGVLLEAMAANPNQSLGELPILSGRERQQLVDEWNNTVVEFPRDVCIHHLFEQQADATPNAIASIHGQRQVTYDELNRRSNQLAHLLILKGVGPEKLVGVCMDRAPDLLIAILAILKAGGAYVALDPDYPPERLQYLVEDCEASIVLTYEALSTRFEATAQILRLDAQSDEISGQSADNPQTFVSSNNLVYAVYTSGSTGQPKGILVTHRSLVNYTLDTIRTYAITSADRRLQFVSVSSDVLATEIFPYLLSGAAVVFSPHRKLASIRDFLQLIEEYKLSHVALPSAYWHEWVSSLAGGEADLPPSLKLVTSGMDKVEPELFHLWKEKVRGHIRWFNAYGPAETTIAATRYEADLLDSERLCHVPIGRPIANTRIYLLDDLRRLVPVGVPGEVYIGGEGVARGYLNRPELTDERFLPNFLSNNSQDRLYRTDDLARYLPDGNLEFLGRLDHQVKIRGYRIELGEIESTLSQNPFVRQAVVVAREDKPGEKQLVAYCVAPEEMQPPSNAEMRRFLQEKLPHYMTPSAFAWLERFPLTPNGKVDRHALPLPDERQNELRISFTIPRNELELELTQIWQELLNTHPVGIRDNFFEIGGHSLLAVALMAEIEKRFDRKLPLTTLFEAPTIEQLTELLSREGWTPSQSSLVLIQPGGSKPPLFCFHAVGGHVLSYYNLARYLGAQQPVYGLQALDLSIDDVPYLGLEEMAARYLQEIQSVQPAGPYFLSGVSYGGTLAFATAKLLHAQNEKVGLVILFDTLGPYVQFKSRAERNAAHMAAVFRLRPGERLRYFRARIRKRLQLLARFCRILPARKRQKVQPESPGATLPVEFKGNQALRQNLKIDQALKRKYIKIAGRIFKDAYPGRVLLFRGKKQFEEISYKDPTLGWAKVAGNVEICEVPGFHIDIIEEPHVQVLCEHLKKYLEEAQSQGI